MQSENIVKTGPSQDQSRIQHDFKKELHDKVAWSKKSTHGDRVLNFTRDYPTEVNRKKTRIKEYRDIKRLLKERKYVCRHPTQPG